MSATEILEQFRRLLPEEQHEVVEKIREEYGVFDDELKPEEIAEPDRRAEDALKNPGRGTPAEEVFAEIRERFAAKEWRGDAGLNDAIPSGLKSGE